MGTRFVSKPDMRYSLERLERNGIMLYRKEHGHKQVDHTHRRSADFESCVGYALDFSYVPKSEKSRDVGKIAEMLQRSIGISPEVWCANEAFYRVKVRAAGADGDVEFTIKNTYPGEIENDRISLGERISVVWNPDFISDEKALAEQAMFAHYLLIDVMWRIRSADRKAVRAELKRYGTILRRPAPYWYRGTFFD